MNIIAFNASPRKKWNTATLLQKALEGAASCQADTKLYHLYDYNIKGCASCLMCKRKGSENNRHCVLNDDLTPLLTEAANADAIILGTPVYCMAESASFRAFIERLVFPFISYDAEANTYFMRKMPTALIYTMNMPPQNANNSSKAFPVGNEFTAPNIMKSLFKTIFGSCDLLLSCNTLQVEDYSKYGMSRFDAQNKKECHETVFPQDCQKAYDLGKKLVSE